MVFKAMIIVALAEAIILLAAGIVVVGTQAALTASMMGWL